jgi:hypothetical protein
LKENESLKEVKSIELMNDEKVAEDKMPNRIDEKNISFRYNKIITLLE